MHRPRYLISVLLLNCAVVNDAKKIGEKFYQDVKAQNFKNASSLVGKMGLESTPVEKWIHLLKFINKKYGNITEYKFKSSGFKSVAGKGTTITLNYKVTYSKIKWDEQLILFKHPTTKKIEIVSYKWNVK